MGQVGDEADGVFVDAAFAERFLHGLDDREGGAVALFAAAQDAGVAALEGKGEGVGRDVRTALIDDGDDAERRVHLPDVHAGRMLVLPYDFADGVRQIDERADAVGHAADPVLIQFEAVQHDVRDVTGGGGDVLVVGGKDVCHMRFERIGDEAERVVLLFGRKGGHIFRGHSRFLAKDDGRTVCHECFLRSVFSEKTGPGIVIALDDVVEHLR